MSIQRLEVGWLGENKVKGIVLLWARATMRNWDQPEDDYVEFERDLFLLCLVHFINKNVKFEFLFS